jgi:Skp family chaperone for outer membrane proteins
MRNILLASVALAAAPLAMAGLGAPALAQSKAGIAVVNVDGAVAQSAAYQTAMQQMQVTYKANIDSFNTRQAALQTELKQKADALEAAIKAAGEKPTAAQQQTLQTQYNQFQQRQQEAQNELNQIQQPVQLARQFVIEQIAAKLEDGLKNVMNKNKIDLLLKAEATEAYLPTVDVTAALTTEINTMVPTVGIVPPQGWRPGGAQAQQRAPAAAAPAPAPAAPAATQPKPQGR